MRAWRRDDDSRSQAVGDRPNPRVAGGDQERRDTQSNLKLEGLGSPRLRSLASAIVANSSHGVMETRVDPDSVCPKPTWVEGFNHLQCKCQGPVSQINPVAYVRKCSEQRKQAGLEVDKVEGFIGEYGG